jgi:hypothetical protein
MSENMNGALWWSGAVTANTSPGPPMRRPSEQARGAVRVVRGQQVDPGADGHVVAGWSHVGPPYDRRCDLRES